MLKKLRKIRKRSPLPEAVRRRLARTVLANLWYERVHPDTRRVLDWTVRIQSPGGFRALFEEIFIDHVYYFEAGRPAPAIIDGGSNIGLAILYFKMLYPNAEIIAFEPNPETFRVLEENVRGNRLPGVTLHQAALGGEAREVAFYAGENPIMSSTIPERAPGSTIRVRQLTLSPYVAGPLDLLKLDVEGAEEDVLDELLRTGRLTAVDQLLIEYHHHVTDPGLDVLSRFLAKLEAAGYGYQIHSPASFDHMRHKGRHYQDIGIYAYRKA